MTDWKPAGYPSLSPYLVCDRAEALIGFLTRVFDARLLRRFDRPDGTLMHAELRIDDSVVMIGGGQGGVPASPTHLHLYVADVDATWARAMAAGADPQAGRSGLPRRLCRRLRPDLVYRLAGLSLAG